VSGAFHEEMNAILRAVATRGRARRGADGRFVTAAQAAEEERLEAGQEEAPEPAPPPSTIDAGAQGRTPPVPSDPSALMNRLLREARGFSFPLGW
jgi:hypothetical protein